jgi:hypothetical protein
MNWRNLVRQLQRFAGVVMIAVLVLALAWRAGGTTSGAAATPRWQYMTLQAPYVNARKRFTITETIATTSSKAIAVPVLATAPTYQTLVGAWNQALARVGTQGWELVSVFRASRAGIDYATAMYFKRPI